MKNALRVAVVVCVSAICAVGLSVTAKAAPYTTVGAAPSFINLEIWVGAPGEEESTLIATIGPQEVSGTANAVVAVDGFGNGSLTFNSSALTIEDINGLLLDLQDLGTITVDFLGVGMGVSSTAIPVVGNVWNLDDIGAPSALDLSLNSGLVDLYDPTGLLLIFLPDGETIDLDTDPVSVDIDGLLGYGIGGSASPGEISFIIPAIDLELLEQLVFIRLTGAINLVVVPEPSTFAMLGMGIVGLGLAIARRRRS